MSHCALKPRRFYAATFVLPLPRAKFGAKFLESSGLRKRRLLKGLRLACGARFELATFKSLDMSLQPLTKRGFRRPLARASVFVRSDIYIRYHISWKRPCERWLISAIPKSERWTNCRRRTSGRALLSFVRRATTISRSGTANKK